MIERKSWVAFVLAALLMLGGVAASEALKPRQSMADMKPKLVLAELVPPSFGVWREVRSMQPVMPDPTVQAIIDMTYSEVLARAYVNDLGQVVMLTIAYGKDQNSEATAAHRPEFCYTGQGFSIKNKGVHEAQLATHALEVQQLVGTKQGYVEPISYWVTLAESATLPGLGRKLAQLRYGLQGQVADGMLVRVSSPNRDLDKAYELHDRFIRDLEQQIPISFRARFFGA
jgi:EpsI family protein